MAVEFPLSPFKRVPFAGADAEIVFIGPDWTAAAFALQVRNNPGDTGAPIISLMGAAAGIQGISATFNANYAYVDENGVNQVAPATIMQIQIDEAIIEAISLGTPYDKPLQLFYDLHVTPAGSVKRVEMYGAFNIIPGVTI